MPDHSDTDRLRIDLALQGGGSHGAFTWGVLDRLLEDEGLEIAGISGTSAGAMNAVALAAGLVEGGRQGAREVLRRFWTGVAVSSPLNHLLDSPFMEPWLRESNPWLSFAKAQAEWMGRMFSPYQLNPFNINPLRDLLHQTIDFDRVRRCDKLQLFIAATQVRTGELRIFSQAELSAEVVLASACLPLLFQAVEVDGEAYWDGGYAGNPSLLPLIVQSPADDLVLVQINPRLRESVPTSAREIVDRINEITFNSSLLKELRMLALLKQLILEEGGPGHTAYAHPVLQRVDALRLHRIDAQEKTAALGASSKMNTRSAFLLQLHAVGREAADAWLRRHRSDLGRRSTIDVATEFATG